MWTSLLFLLTASLAQSQSCHKYMCNDGSNDFLPSTCIFYLNATDTFYLDPCDPSSSISYCTPISSPGNSSCIAMPPSAKGLSYPGEPCYNNDTCAYGYCYDSVCRGNGTAQNCTSSYDCDFGNFCDTSYSQPICRIQLPIGNPFCIADEMCVNNAQCVFGICTKVMSALEGETASNCYSNSSMICASTQCYNGYCLGYPKSDYALPKLCSNDTQCYSNSYNNDPYYLTFYSECTCGYNANGYAYCGLFPGDSYYNKYLAKLSEWYSSSAINQCHTLRRTALNCIESVWDEDDIAQYLYFYYNSMYYSQIQGNDKCVREIYGAVYTDAVEEYEDSDDTAVWLVVPLALGVAF